MAHLLDTDIAIHLRDGEPSVWKKLRDLDPPFSVSAMSRIELENGVYRDLSLISVRRASLDKIFENVQTLYLTKAEIAMYRDLLAKIGFSKRKIADRLTAATALVHDLTLVTMNGRDFQDIPGLKLAAWPSPPTPHPPSATPQ